MHGSQVLNHPAMIKTVPKLYYVKFLLLALGYGFNGTTFTAIPFLFYRAKLNCVDGDGNSYDCSNEDACANPYGFQEQTEYPQIGSIVSLLDLYCDRKILEAWMLTIGQLGKVIAYVILVFFPVNKKIKEYIIYSSFIVTGTILSFLHYFHPTQMFIVAFFMWNMLFSIFYGLIYNHITDVYPYIMSENGSAYINTSWPGIMILFMGFSYFFGTWENILIHFTGIPLLLIGIGSYVLKFYMENNSEYIRFAELVQQEQQALQPHDESANQNQTVTEKLKENYEAVKKSSTLRKNLAIWTLGWTCNGLCYIGCYYQLNTLQGNLYFNNLMSTIFEVLASVLAVILVKRMNLQNIIITTYFIIGVAFTSCIFVNNDLNNVESVSSLIINLSPVIIAKVSYEIMWTVLVKYQSLAFHPKYHQIQFSFSNMVGMGISNAIPFYKYFMESISLSPFIGYGLFCLAASYYSTQYTEVGVVVKKQSLTTPLKKQEDFQNIELQELYDIDQQLSKIHV